jgi:hypothetical protein
LGVLRIRDWFPFLCIAIGENGERKLREQKIDALQPNVAQIGVWDITDEDPPHFENPLPFVGGPNCTVDLCE